MVLGRSSHKLQVSFPSCKGSKIRYILFALLCLQNAYNIIDNCERGAVIKLFVM